MKKILTSMITITLLSLSSINVSAISATDFNPGKIIDDLVFFNKDSMTADQIQNFLNSKVTTCETNRPAISGDSGTVYGPPFICLRDFYENPSSTYQINYTYKDTSGSDKSETRTFYRNNAYEFTALTPNYKNANFSEGIVSIKATIKSIAGVKPQGSLSAAQIIYNAAQKYNINPQVLLVTLQKEQGLITDSWPLAWQFQAAMGYGCPDNGPCSSKYSGFSSQVENAAWQFRAYTNNPNAYNFKAGVNRFVQFNPVSSCGGSNIYLQNQATANLYNYTPYQPNGGALINMTDSTPGGTSNCGAYGNRNFFWYFTKWFGSTYSTIIKKNNENTLYYVSGNKIFSIDSFSMMDDYSLSKNDIQILDSSEFIKYNQSGNLYPLIKSDDDFDDDGPTVYLVSNGYRHPIRSFDQLNQLGLQIDNISILSYSDVIRLPQARSLSNFLRSPDGFIYKIDAGKKRGIFSYQNFISYSPSGEYSDLSFNTLSMIPTGQAMLNEDAVMRDYSGHFWYVSGGVWKYITSMSVFNCLNLSKLSLYSFNNSQSSNVDNGSISSCFVYSKETGKKYLLDNNNKIEYNSTWGVESFNEVDDGLINYFSNLKYPRDLIIQNAVNQLYVIREGKIRYIPNMATFKAAGYNIEDIYRSSNLFSLIQEGGPILNNGQLINDGGKIYVYYNNFIYYIPTMNYIKEFDFNFTNILPSTNLKIDEYKSSIRFNPVFKYNDSLYIKARGYLWKVPYTLEKDYGLDRSKMEDVGNLFGDINNIKPISRFVKLSDSNDIYLIENGFRRKINSWSKLVELGGSDSISEISKSVIEIFPIGQTLY